MSSGITIWRPAGWPGVEVKRGEGVSHSHPPHWHEEVQLCLVESGDGFLRYRGRDLPTPPGVFFVVPPGEVHSNWASAPEGCGFRTVNASLDSLRIEPDLRKRISDLAVGVTDEPRLVSLFRTLHETLSGTATRLEQETRLLAFLRRLLDGREPSRMGREPGAVHLAQEYLEAHWQRNVTLAELSSLTGLSNFHLVRVFRQAVGIPPHAYQKTLRVVRAQSLLNSGRRVADVAATVGFADQAHLTRHFKKIVGVPPGRYQDLSRNHRDPALADSRYS